MRIGVLALQGDYIENLEILRRAMKIKGYSGNAIAIKDRSSLNNIDGLVIPGGESTVIGRLLEKSSMLEKLRDMIEKGLPTLGICAGAILMAKKVRDRVVGETGQPIIGVMSIGVIRNAFGRQRESFELEVEIGSIGRKIRAAFIRAPAIIELWGGSRPLAEIIHNSLGKITALAQENNMIASIFHPEITGETAVHEILLDLIRR